MLMIKLSKLEKGNVELSSDQVSIYKTLRNTFVTFNNAIALRDVVDSYLEKTESQTFTTPRRINVDLGYRGREKSLMKTKLHIDIKMELW